jgi:hypothetical protein
MWCVLDEKNTFMFHLFQHASESLLTCWSWFQRTRESSDDSNMKCGFYLKQNLKVSPWSGQLIDLMGCSVSYGQTPFRKQSQNNQTKIWHYAENAGGGLHWFEKPEDADSPPISAAGSHDERYNMESTSFQCCTAPTDDHDRQSSN